MTDSFEMRKVYCRCCGWVFSKDSFGKKKRRPKYNELGKRVIRR